jgi:hypothetical protein
MKVGDLVILKHQGNGHPNFGLIVMTLEEEEDRYKVLWDCPEWSMGMWKEHELVVISESR